MKIAGGEDLQGAGDDAGDHAEAEEDGAIRAFAFLKDVERADSGHDEGGGNDGSAHVVRVLKPGPGVEEELGEAGDFKDAVGQERVADGVLHPGVGDDDEEAGDPGAREDEHGGEPVEAAGETLFTEEEETEEGGLEEEGEDAFHGEGHADDAAGAAGELAPVGAELELHGDAGDDAEEEVDCEDPGPEAGGGVVPGLLVGIVGAERDRFEDDDQKRESHGELGEEIVVRDGEAEVNAVECKCVQSVLLAVQEEQKREPVLE